MRCKYTKFSFSANGYEIFFFRFNSQSVNESVGNCKTQLDVNSIKRSFFSLK